jgi:2,3-bisphosphoglycerate-independent phosphoglycerate mutase
LFGMGEVAFPGRARLEALGHSLTTTPGALLLFAALRPSSLDNDVRIWITGRVRRDEPAVARDLLDQVRHYETECYTFDLTVFDRGEAILTVTPIGSVPIGHVTDSDPFFEHLTPMMLPLATRHANGELEGSESTAEALSEYLRWARATLSAHPLNIARVAEGLPALDTLTTKWSSVIESTPSFRDVTGLNGAVVPTSPFYRGLGRLLGMDSIDATRGDNSLADSLDAARSLIDRGAQFVHVHTKVTDEAGHLKDPHAKLAAVEWCDTQLAALLKPPFTEWVVAITGDHATPASGGVLHTGDPTPFVVRSPDARPDAVTQFGEDSCRSGLLGVIAASDVLPLMCSHANRPRFLGHRPGAYPTIALPEDPEPFR